MSEWKIARRTGVCTGCERAFEDGERHVSTLRIGPEGLARAELCSAWWNRRPQEARGEACRAACEARAAQGTPGASDPGDPAATEDVFWWFSRHSAATRRTLRLDLESLERLFLELEGRSEERLRELRYVLCLLLLRKRRLRVARIERGPEGESFVVRRPRREQEHRVFVHDFSPARMAEIRSELQAIFDGAEPDDVEVGEGEADPAEEAYGADAEEACRPARRAGAALEAT